MPELVKLYIRSSAIGFAIAAAFVALLLWFDVMTLWQLASGSDHGILTVALLWIVNGIVFVGVQFGWAVMALAEKDDTQHGWTPAAPEYLAVPIPVDRVSKQVRQLKRN